MQGTRADDKDTKGQENQINKVQENKRAIQQQIHRSTKKVKHDVKNKEGH